MALPGLHVSAPVQEVQNHNTHELKERSEWRFEVAFGTKIEVKLISGNAELFGTELAVQQPYTFTGTKAAIFTWQGCRLEVTGECLVEYVADETPNVSYFNLHFALEKIRDECAAAGRDGPRVMIVGPENAGKTSLAKMLTAYATRSGRQPVLVNLDPKEGVLTVPGTFSAATFTSILDVEEGWGSSPTNGPTQVPVKLPLVYFLGSESPEEDPVRSKPILSRLALSVINKLHDNNEAKATGCIIDTPGSFSQGKTNYDILQHAISEFQVNVLITLGSERLYSDLVRRNNDQRTIGGDQITVVKLEKSGGCVDRDQEFRLQSRQAQVKEYFFGDAKNTLSPHTQQVDFSYVSIFRYRGSNDDEFSSSFLPGDYETSGDDSTSIFDLVKEPTLQLQNALLALVHADPKEPQEVIRDASIIGFIFVAEVDEAKKKLKVLAPLSGRLPNKALVWGKFPEGSGDLVG